MKKIFFVNAYPGLQKKLALHADFQLFSLSAVNNNTFVNAEFIKSLGNTVEDADALVVRTNCHVDSAMLDLFPSARIVLRAGHGFDNIDVEECTRRKVYVFNTTGVFTEATADLTVGHILNASRHISDANASMHRNLWERERFTGFELRNAKVGIVGLGSVGSAVAQRLQAFGCETLVYDPYKDPNSTHKPGISDFESKLYQTQNAINEIIEAVNFVSLADLLTEADIVTLHAPLTEETLYIIDKQELIMMKKSALLVNTARGKLVQEDALYDALTTGKIKAAAIDTFAEEPAYKSKLLELDNVFATPHLGSRTSASLKRAISQSEEILVNALIENDFSEALNYTFI